MKNDIYTMLNESNINLDDYEKEDFNDIEKKILKANFRKSINRKTFRKRNMIAAIAFVALTVGILGTNADAAPFLNITNIANLLGIEKNLDDYKTVVNKAVTDKGITVQLNEVILDGDELIVSYNIASDQKLKEHEVCIATGDVYINGKKMSYGAGGSAKNIDDYTTESVMKYDLINSDLKGNLNIKIVCSNIMLNGNEKKGKWNFEFKSNSDELRKDTKEMPLNNEIILENGQKYTLEKYTDNSIGQKIYASISNFQTESTYDVELRGTDNLGNKVLFSLIKEKDMCGLFKIQNIYGNLNENAKILTLTPYAAKYPEKSGKIGEYKKIGEPCTLDLSQLK